MLSFDITSKNEHLIREQAADVIVCIFAVVLAIGFLGRIAGIHQSTRKAVIAQIPTM